MPIVVSRPSGVIQTTPNYSPAEIDRAWEAIVQRWAAENAAQRKALADQYASEPRGD